MSRPAGSGRLWLRFGVGFRCRNCRRWIFLLSFFRSGFRYRRRHIWSYRLFWSFSLRLLDYLYCRLRWWERPYQNVGFDRLDRDLLTGDGWSAAYYVSHSLNQYEITRRSGQTAGDRRRQICRLARKNQGVLWNSRLRRSNIIGHLLISWLASPESALLRSRRSVLPCEWF